MLNLLKLVRLVFQRVEKWTRFRGYHHSLHALVITKDPNDIGDISYLTPRTSYDHVVFFLHPDIFDEANDTCQFVNDAQQVFVPNSSPLTNMLSVQHDSSTLLDTW